MKTTIKIILCFFSLMLLSCSDFIEEDLTDKSITLYVPADGINTKNTTQQFQWKEIEGAESYNLFIVKPSFSAIEEIVCDTTISTNKFSISLDKGNYEWRVIGSNYSSEAISDTFAFSIDSVIDISEQTIVILEPTSSYTNSNKVYLKWRPVDLAESYKIEIRSGSWSDQNIDSSFIITSTDTYITLSEGNYSLGIQAENENSMSQFTCIDICIDKTSPLQPTLIEPTDQGTISDSIVLFSWSHSDELSNLLYDTLYIATSSDFNAADTELFGISDNSSNIQITFSDNGDYYWRIRSVDQSGNYSEYSITRKLTIELP